MESGKARAKDEGDLKKLSFSSDFISSFLTIDVISSVRLAPSLGAMRLIPRYILIIKKLN